MSSNNTTSYLEHSSIIFSISGTSPSTETNISTDGDSSINIFSRCSKSADKSWKLESHNIGSNPNCITGDKSVAHATDGTTTLLFFK